jgi:hypothetical protein
LEVAGRDAWGENAGKSVAFESQQLQSTGVGETNRGGGAVFLAVTRRPSRIAALRGLEFLFGCK